MRQIETSRDKTGHFDPDKAGQTRTNRDISGQVELTRWPWVDDSGFFDDALRHIEKRSHGLWTVEGIKDRVERGIWQFWVFHEGTTMLAIAGSCIGIADNGDKYAEILFCAGTGRKHMQEKITEFEEWARAEGCTRVRSIARLGWARTLPGYRVTHAFIEKELT